MNDLRTAAQQALEALYQAREFTELYDTEHAAAVNERCHENITALRAALAQQAEPGEPVAWLVMDGNLYVQYAANWQGAAHEHINDAINEHDLACARTWRVVPVYTALAQQAEPVAQQADAAIKAVEGEKT